MTVNAAGLLDVGTLLAGKYLIERVLAEGAMGQVYVARQQPIGRQVAIKVLKRALTGDPELVERFLREAVAVSKLHHPNTITVLDYGETDEKILYIAMEFLEGESLEQLLDSAGPLETARAVEIAAQVASALTEAHHRGILHRDLKPANIFISQVVGKGEFVKVLDFGIAKLLDNGETPLTRAGMVFGTPEYMAPEQSSGGELDGRTDLYSLGVLLWQMLTTKLPYNGTNPVDTVLRHSTEPIPELPDHIPADLRRFVYKAMAKDKADRPADAEAFIKEMQAAFGPPPAAAAPTPPPESSTGPSPPLAVAPVSKPRERSLLMPALGFFVLTLLLAVVVGAGIMLFGQDEEKSAPPARITKEAPEKVVETTIKIDCPQGKATVRQGSKRLGTTPHEIEGKPGKKITVTVEKDGFKSAKETVKFPKKGTKRVEVSLKKAKKDKGKDKGDKAKKGGGYEY